jgi:hypothetical protein
MVHQLSKQRRITMKTLKMIVTALAFVLFVTGAAEAVNLFTVPLFAADGDSLACEIVNVSNGSRIVRTQVLRADGSVAFDTSNVVLAAGEVGTTTVTGAELFGGPGYCQFTVTSKFHYRAGAKIRPASGSDFIFAPAE